MLQGYGRPGAAVSIRMCVEELKLRVSPKGQRLHKGLADHLLLRAHTNVLQNLSMQSCTEGQGLRRRGRPNSAGSIRMCVAKQTNSRLHPRSKAGHVLDQTRVEPTDQGLQRFGRATDDVSIHMCVAE